MADVTFDDTEWPILAATFHEEMSNDEVDRYFVAVRGYVQRRQRFALILDVRRLAAVDAVRRKLHADFLESIAPLTTRYLLGAGIVLESTAQRGVVTAIFWLQPPTFPVEMFSGISAARAWARDRVRDSDARPRTMPPPSGPRSTPPPGNPGSSPPFPASPALPRSGTFTAAPRTSTPAPASRVSSSSFAAVRPASSIPPPPMPKSDPPKK